MSGWTGGQYSLYRAFLGSVLFVRFVTPLTYDADVWFGGRLPLFGIVPNLFKVIDPAASTWLFALGGGSLALLLAVGWWDRFAAVVLAYLVAAGLASHTHGDLGWSLLALVLLLHAAQPPAPFGSLAALGRVDPAGGWWARRSVRRVAWSATALLYAYHGTSGLVAGGFGGETAAALAPWLDPRAESALFPLTLGFAPLALLARVRPLLWTTMVAVHVTWAAMGWGGGWHAPMIPALGMLFDPCWVRPSAATGSERVYYDGSCGMCHGFVRFLLAEETAGEFRFAPLEGTTFRAEVDAARRDGLPDSIVVRTADGRLETRSAAALYLLARLGGVWRVLSLVGRAVPRGVRDAVYDGVAAIRYRVFGRREKLCPLMPEALTRRFDG